MTRRRAVRGAVTILACVLSTAALAQNCISSIPDETPTSRFQSNADGTATDTQTGLMWMRCALGQSWNAQSSSCNGTASTMTWQAALQAVQTLDQGSGFAGYTDWRLPNLRELMSIDRYHCTDPTINLSVFPGTPSDVFWSSSPLEGITGDMWAIDFSVGQAEYDILTNPHYVRLVRAGAYP